MITSRLLPFSSTENMNVPLNCMLQKKVLVGIIIVFSVLLLTDLVVLTIYTTHYKVTRVVKEWSPKQGFVYSGKYKKLSKRLRGPVVTNHNSSARVFPFNRTKLLSEHPECIPGKSRSRLRNFFGPMNLSSLSVYIDKMFLKNKKLMSLSQPFGFKDVDTHVMHVLKYAKQSSLPAEVNREKCLRCVVVGNSGLMRASHLGDIIDNFDVIIRMNDGPVIHHEKDVGSRTTIRLAYPESAFRRNEGYTPDWHLVIIAFKSMDLVWLETVIQGKRMLTGEGFWKRIAKSVPKKPEEIRLLNPEVIQLGAELIGYVVDNNFKGKNIPTTGFIAVTMALTLCDEVSVVGFGYDPNNPKGYLHYYDGLTMDVIKKVGTHDITHETRILAHMVEQGIVHDLTGGVQIYER